MSNHIHLLIQPLLWSLSKIMELLSGRYAKYLNNRLKRTGHVFQSRFQHRLCRNDSYLLQLVRYIHLNPVRAGIIDAPAAWPYSGHNEYLGGGTQNLIDPGLVLSMFDADPASAQAGYERFVLDGQPGGRDDTAKVKPIAPIYASALPLDAPSRGIEIIPKRVPLDILAAASAAAADIPLEQLHTGCRIRAVCRARRDFMHEAFVAGHRTTEIADYLALSVSAVSKVLVRSCRQAE
jgi:hypothetical protein